MSTRARHSIIATLALLAAAGNSMATTYTWSGGGADGNWSTSGNWDAGPVSGATNDLIFSANPNGWIANNDIASPFDVNSLAFNASGMTIAGGTIRLNTAGTKVTVGNNSTTFSNGLELAAASTLSATLATIDFSGQFTGPGKLTYVNAGTGGGTILKFASATANTIDGLTLGNGTANKGRATIQVAMDDPFGGAGTAVNFNNSGDCVVTAVGAPRTISSSIANLRANVTFTGTNMTWMGNFTPDGGGTRNFVNNVDAGATLTMAAGPGAYFYCSRMTITGTGLTVIPGEVRDGAVPGGSSFGFPKSGSGTMRLTGANVYIGQTTVNAGTLEFSSVENKGSANASALGKPTVDGTREVIALGNTTVAGTLKYIGTNAPGHSTDRPLNLVGTTGGGRVDASGVGPIAFSGGVTASVAGAKTLTLLGTNTDANTLGGVITDSSNGVTSLTKDGPGTWVLTGASTYTGITTLSNGVLCISSLADGGVACNLGKAASAAANLALHGGTLRLTNAAAPQVSDRLLTLGAAGGALDSSSATAANILALTNSGAVALGGAGTRTLTLTGGNTGHNTLAAVIGDDASNATALVKSGAGTWRLSGANTYTGPTTIGDGTLLVDGSLAAGSDVTVASGGTLGGTGTVNGTLTVDGGGTVAPGGSVGTLTHALAGGKTATYAAGAAFAFDLGTPGTGDAVAFTGLSADTTNVCFNGNAIDVSNAGGLAPGTYVLFTFDAANAYSGTVAIGTGLEAYPASALQYSPTGISLTVASSTTDTEAPSAPANVTATPLSSRSILVAWDASTDNVAVTEYRVYTNGNFAAPAATVFAPGTNITATNLTANTLYSFRVAAFDAATNAATSVVAQATTYEAPGAPVGVTATALSWNEIEIAWTAAGGNKLVTGYRIFTNGVLAHVAAGDAMGYTNTGLQSETEYAYTVSETDADAESAPSDPPATATTPMAPTGPWNGAGASGNWSDQGAGGNWSRGTNPVSSAATDLAFASNINGRVSTNDLADPFDVNSLTFQVSGMTLDGGGIRLASAAPGIAVGANAVAFNNRIVLATNATLSSAANALVEFHGQLEGPGRLTYNCGGTGAKITFAGPTGNTINGFTHTGGNNPTLLIAMNDPFGGEDGTNHTTVTTLGALTYSATGEPRTVSSTLTNARDVVFSGTSMTWNGSFNVEGGGTRAFTCNVSPGSLLTLAAGTGSVFYWSRLTHGGSGDLAIPGIVKDGPVPGSPGGTRGVNKNGAGLLRLTGPNVYLGHTVVNNGTLEFNSVENMGSASASALGMPTVDGANEIIVLGSAGSTATLKYIGTAPGGHSTDRPLELAGTTGGGVLDASGDGPIAFTGGVGVPGLGNKTLTLQGTNTGLNTVGGAISNSDGFATALIKDGPGVWQLTGTSTYTGATEIKAGTLLVNGALAAGGAVTVSNGATLGGSGTIGGGVSVAGTLAPGASVGTLTIGGDLTFDPAATAAVEIASAASNDLIVVAGMAQLDGALALDAGAYMAPAGSTQVIVSAGLLLGVFANAPTNGSPLVAGSNIFLVTYSPTDVVLTVEGGLTDADGDGLMSDIDPDDHNPNTDGGAMGDYDEWLAYGNATSVYDSFFVSMVSRLPSGAVVAWPAISNRHYRVFGVTSPVGGFGAWTNLVADLEPPSDGKYTNPALPAVQLYRVDVRLNP